MPEAGTEPFEDRAEQALLPQTTVWLMAITVGVIVANIYYVQPLVADIGNTFGLSVTRAGTAAMLSQVGTALGMFLFVPLGDKYEHRSLILLLVIGGFVSLLLMSIAPNALWLGCAAFAVGVFAANVHVIVPFAAHLAAPQQRGRVVAGILFGVLLARTFSGSIGALLGWCAVYGVAAGAIGAAGAPTIGHLADKHGPRYRRRIHLRKRPRETENIVRTTTGTESPPSSVSCNRDIRSKMVAP
jgi:predicted MFS family arabinose efflux permease